MEVTRDNFIDAYHQFTELASTAKYCSLDLELTGIFLPHLQETAIDSVEQRYSYMAEIASTCNIIQVGYCFAHENADTKEVTLTPFNIYMYTHEQNKHRSVTMDGSSIQFNVTHNMDFQKWITKGVWTPLPSQQDELIQQHQTRLAAIKTYTETNDIDGVLKPLVPVNPLKELSPADAQILEEITTKIAQFVESLATNGDCEAQLTIEDIPTSIQASSLRAMYDLLTAQKVMHFGDAGCTSAYIHVDRSQPGCITLSASTAEKYLATATLASENTMVSQLGAIAFWNKVKEFQLPIIGHNCFYDLLFMTAAYESKQLPETFEEFRVQLTHEFPQIYDTKYIYNAPMTTKLNGYTPSPSSSLGPLLKLFSDPDHHPPFPKPIQVLRPGYDTYSRNEKFHEAGYDAYATVWVFIYLLALLQYNDVDHQINYNHGLYTLDPLPYCFMLDQQKPPSVLKDTTLGGIVLVNYQLSTISPKRDSASLISLDELTTALTKLTAINSTKLTIRQINPFTFYIVVPLKDLVDNPATADDMSPFVSHVAQQCPELIPHLKGMTLSHYHGITDLTLNKERSAIKDFISKHPIVLRSYRLDNNVVHAYVSKSTPFEFE